MALTLDSAPTYMKRTTTVVFQISDPISFSGISVEYSGNALEITHTHNLSAGVYTIICVVPDNLALLHNATGYPWTITAGAETVVTGNIPLLPEPAYDFVDLTSPTTTSSLLTGYTAVTAVTGDQLVYAKRNYPEGLELTNVNADSTYTLSAALGIDSRIKRYVIQANGTVAAKEILEENLTTTIVVDDVNATTSTPTITGTCNKLLANNQVTIGGTHTYNTLNINKNWSFPTDPFEIPNDILVASNLTDGVTTGSYLFDHSLLELDNGDIYMAFREGISHVGNDGRSLQMYSSDRGVTWTTPTLLHEDASWDVRGIALAKAQNGDLTYFVTLRDTSLGTSDAKDVIYKRSTDNGATWGAATSLNSLFPDAKHAGGFPLFVPWGTAIETSQGLMQLFYSHNQAWVLYSTDNGVTWGNRQVVYDRTDVTEFYGEPTPIKIDDDNLIILVRKQSNGDLITHMASDDGGLSWSSPQYGEITWTAELITSPPTTRGCLVGDNIIIGWGARRTIASILTVPIAKYHALYAPEEYLDATYPARKIVYNSTTNDTGDAIDFGMPDLLTLSGIDYTCLMVWYDNANSTPNLKETDIHIGTCQRW